MKMISIAIIALFLLSCINNNNKEINQKIDSKVENLPKASLKTQSAIWGLSSYLDSIVEHKEIAKYRLQRPSWFGILLEITNDSIKSYGSIIELNAKLNLESDTLCTFNSFAGKWLLLKDSQTLCLKQIPKEGSKADALVYEYKERNDLSFLLQDLDKVHKISSNITSYFNEMLLSGVYYDSKTKRPVEFKKDASLNGLGEYEEYKVRDYFGTLHPHQNLDVIYLRKKGQKYFDQFNWKFEKNKLVLTDFIWIDSTEKYALGKEQWILFID